MPSPKPPSGDRLSRRERQIMDVVYRLGEASVADVKDRIPDLASYNSVRVTLSILERKGHLRHKRDGQRYLYFPTVARTRARRSAIQHLLETFFGGSPSDAILALLDMSQERITPEERSEILSQLRDEKKPRRRGKES